MGGGWSMPHPNPFTLGKRPSTHCTGGWVVPSTSLDERENLAHTRIWSVDCPAPCEFLYWLCYPSPQKMKGDEISDGQELVLTDWIHKITDSRDDALVSYWRQFKVNLSKKNHFNFLFLFLAEDKFSYSTVPSLHSLRVCYIKVWYNKRYHCDRERN